MNEINELRERAEAAEAELLAVREDNHSMMLEIDGLRTERDRLAAELAKLREQKPALYVVFSGHDESIKWWSDEPPKPAMRASVKKYYAAPIPAPAAPSVPDALIRLRDMVTRIPHRKEFLGGQQFAYVRLCEVVGEIDAMLQSAPAPSVPDGCAIVSRTLTPEAWKRLCNADIWPVTPRSFQRMLDVLMEVAMLQSAPAPSVPEEWREAMQDAHDTFQRYAELHQAKGTQDGYEKAKANQKLANRLYALLQSATSKDSGV